MDSMLIDADFVSGLFEFVIAIVFLILSYKFSALAKHYKEDAFRHLSLGFRFLFFSYFIPIVGLFAGSLIIIDPNDYFELLFAGLPYFMCMAVGLVFFFKSIKAIIIKYANA